MRKEKSLHLIGKMIATLSCFFLLSSFLSMKFYDLFESDIPIPSLENITTSPKY